MSPAPPFHRRPFAPRWAAVAAVLIGLLTTGCASQWEEHFQPTDRFVAQALPRDAAVEVRSVPHERLRRYEAAEHELLVNSTTAPADWDEQQRRAATARLLEALQLTNDADDIDVLGWSEFHTTERPSAEDLRKFARKIGANLVVLARAPAGQVTTIQQEPIITYRDTWVTPSHGRGRGRIVSDRSTTWVPVAVTEDQEYYRAFFLRRKR